MRNWYTQGDKLLKVLLRDIAKVFRRSRLTLDFDNINKPVTRIRQESIELYKQLKERNDKTFQELGLFVFLEAYREVLPRAPDSELRKKAKDTISEEWVRGLHKQYDPVTKYVYSSEVERKRARFFESIVSDLEAKDRRGMESDYKTAENLWARQTRQAMITTEDEAAIAAYKDAGVKNVRWDATLDRRTCAVCRALDGKVFPIDSVPDKPHPNCRCTLIPETDDFTNTEYRDTIDLEDIPIRKSVGAKANYGDVMDLITGEKFEFVKGSRITSIKVFAGKGTNTIYRDAYKYADKVGGAVEDWQHVKGIAVLDFYGETRTANIHWSQCEGYGIHDCFVKEWLD